MNQVLFRDNRPCYLSWSRFGFWRIIALAVYFGAALVLMIPFWIGVFNAEAAFEIASAYFPDLFPGIGYGLLVAGCVALAGVFVVSGLNRLWWYLSVPRK